MTLDGFFRYQDNGLICICVAKNVDLELARRLFGQNQQRKRNKITLHFPAACLVSFLLYSEVAGLTLVLMEQGLKSHFLKIIRTTSEAREGQIYEKKPYPNLIAYSRVPNTRGGRLSIFKKFSHLHRTLFGPPFIDFKEIFKSEKSYFQGLVLFSYHF